MSSEPRRPDAEPASADTHPPQPAATSPGPSDEGAGAPDPRTDAGLENIVLALLFASEEPLTIRRIGSIVEDATGDQIRCAIRRWQRRFDEESWSIRIERIAGGYQITTRPDYAPFIARLYSGRRRVRLSRAAMEVLAIVAYRQPVTRAEIETIRGVGSGGVIANLMERSLIRITGKARVLGAPFLYGTTPEFLEYLGLDSLDDLPSLEELERLLEREAHPEGAVESGAEAAPAGAAESEPHTRSVPDGDGVDDEDESFDFEGAVAALDRAARVAAEAAARSAPAEVAADDVPAGDAPIPPIRFEESGGDEDDGRPDEGA